MARFVACLALSVLGIVGTLAGCKAAEEAKKDNTKVTVEKEIPAGKRLTVELSGTADEADLKLLQTTLEKRIGAATADFAGVTDRPTEADAKLNVTVTTLRVERELGVTAQTIYAKCIYNVELVDNTDGVLFSAVIEDFGSREISSSVGDASAHEKDVKTETIKSSVAKLYKKIARCIKQEDWGKPRPLVVEDIPRQRIGVVSLEGAGTEFLAQWSDFIEQQIGAVSFLELINRAQMDRTLTEKKLESSGDFDERTVSELGQSLGIKYLVHANVKEAQGKITLTLKVWSVETQKQMPPFDETGNTGEDKKVAYKVALKMAQEIAKLHKP